MPTMRAVEKLGAAPLGVTVVELPLSLASCVTVEGCAPSAEASCGSVSKQRICKEFAQGAKHTDEGSAARVGEG